MDIRIIADGTSVPIATYWDTVWDPDNAEGDWSIADPGGALGTKGGLAAQAGLATAILLALFSDKRAPDHVKLDTPERGGWFGDRVDVRTDLGETDLGSLIWIYERSALTAETARGVRDAAIEALDPIVRQGAVARFDVAVELFREDDRLDLLVDAFSRDGAQVYSQRFALLWNQV